MSTNSGVSSPQSISSTENNVPDKLSPSQKKLYLVLKSKESRSNSIPKDSRKTSESKKESAEKESFTFQISSADFKLSVEESSDSKKDSKNILNKKISKSPNVTERSLDFSTPKQTSGDSENCNYNEKTSRNLSKFHKLQLENNLKNTDIITPLSETCDVNVNDNQKIQDDHKPMDKMKKPRVPANQSSVKKSQNGKPELDSPVDENNRVYTKCGNCKSGSKNSNGCHSKSEKSGSGKKINSSPLKKLSRSALAIESDKPTTDKVGKYSPCASRLAACSKILSSDSVNDADSPIHVGRLKANNDTSEKSSKKLPALSLLNVQHFSKNQRSTRSKSTSECCLTPTSDGGTNLSYSPTGTEILSLEEVQAPQVSMPDVSKSYKKKSEKKLFGNSRNVALEVSVDGGRYKPKYLPP